MDGKSKFLSFLKRRGLWITATAAAIFILFGALTLALPKKEYSQSEKRALKQKVSLSVDALFDGEFGRSAGGVFSDQFFGRDALMRLNLMRLRLTGQSENGGVYIGRHGRLFLKPSPENPEALDKKLKAINAFVKEAGVNAYALIAPNAITVYPDDLPAGAAVPDQREQLGRIKSALEGVSFVDVTDTLVTYADEGMFYYTDHHWTSEGAKRASDDLLKAMGIENSVSFDRLVFDDAFRGTLSSKSGAYSEKDTVSIYRPKTELAYTVTFPDGRKSATLFDDAALESNDSYTVFFGGNDSKVDVITTAETGRRMLVFKDSYANSLMQFLWPYFEEIIMIDPRLNYDDVKSIVKSAEITDILFMYNLDTFLQDVTLTDAIG